MGEKEPSIMPEFDLFPRLTKTANFIKRLIPRLPSGNDLANRGGGPLLDRELYEQQELFNATSD